MKYFIILISLCFITNNPKKNSRAEIKFNFISASRVIQDSIGKKKFNEILKLYENKNHSEALKKALILFESQGKISPLSSIRYKTSNLIADIYKRSYNYDKSILYYKSSLDILDSKKRILLENKIYKSNEDLLSDFAFIFLQLGSAYQRLYMRTKNNKNEENEEKLKLKLKKYKDSSILFYDKLDKINSFSFSILKHKADSYNNLSAIYLEDSLMNKAKSLVLKSIDIYKSNKSNSTDIKLAGSYNNLGNIYLFEGKFKLAKNEYYKGTELIKNNNDTKR